MKKVIFILVDSLMPNILEKCFASRTVPALQFLFERGQYRPDCVTVFPTMTASVDGSLTTGCYPDQHKIPSLIWYDPIEKEIINYINGAKCIWKIGLQKSAKNVLLNLNEKHLSQQVKTIYEELAERQLTSASINLIIHRGKNRHKLSLPLPLEITSGIDKNHTVSGPEILTLGVMAFPEGMREELANMSISPRGLYGINDDFAISAAVHLVKSGKQPDFMIVYLPDNDHEVHKVGPENGEGPLIKVDQHIQKLLHAFGDWDQALQENIFIITSDHGQTTVGKDESYNVDLDQLLGHFQILQLGEKVQQHHQIVICNNERMAYLYPLNTEVFDSLIGTLKMESRIDIIAWKEDHSVIVLEAGSGRKMAFYRNGEFIDPYAQTWHLEGEHSILDIQISQNDITYGGDYPDALARLYGALFSQDYPMIVINARPRFEFKTKYHPTHNQGGSHGSLHKWDSTIPLIVTGADTNIPIPRRLVELKEYIISLYS